MMTTTKTLFAGAAVAAAMTVAGTASANSTAQNVDVYYNPTGFDFQGTLAGFFLTDNGDSFSVNLGNASGSGSLQNVYFEEGFNELADGFTRTEEEIVEFNEVAPGNPPVADSIAWEGSALEFESTSFATGLGRVSDRLILTFDYADGVDFNDVADTIGTNGFRVAVFGTLGGDTLIAGVTSRELRNPSAGTVSSVPTPTAAAGGLALLGLAGLKRRRNG